MAAEALQEICDAVEYTDTMKTMVADAFGKVGHYELCLINIIGRDGVY